MPTSFYLKNGGPTGDRTFQEALAGIVNSETAAKTYKTDAETAKGIAEAKAQEAATLKDETTTLRDEAAQSAAAAADNLVDATEAVDGLAAVTVKLDDAYSQNEPLGTDFNIFPNGQVINSSASSPATNAPKAGNGRWSVFSNNSNTHTGLQIAAQAENEFYIRSKGFSSNFRPWETLVTTVSGDARYVQREAGFVKVFNSPTDLLADTTMTYSEVSSGEMVYVADCATTYVVLASGASTSLMTTAGGLKLEPKPTDGWVTAYSLGITATGDQTSKVSAAFDLLFSEDYKLGFDGAGMTISITDVECTDKPYVKLRNVNFFSTKTALIANGWKDDWTLKFKGSKRTDVDITADYKVGQHFVVVDDASGLNVGDLIKLRTTRLIPSDHRGQWQEGMMNRILGIDGNTLRLDVPFAYSGKANDQVTGTIQAISVDRFTLTLDNILGTHYRDRQCLLTITSGPATGEDRFIIETTGSDVRHMGGNPGQYEKYSRGAWSNDVTVGDTYRWEWSSRIEVYDYINVFMENVHLKRVQKNDFPTRDDYGFHGLIIENSVDAQVLNCSADGFNAVGLSMEESLYPLIRDWKGLGCNMEGKGYSISFDSVTHGVIDNAFSRNCRAGFDASGAGAYTVNARVNNHAIGGGPTHWGGRSFFPEGVAGCRATGSHGSGLNTIYDGCTGTNVQNCINSRGINEKAYNIVHRGAGESGLAMSFGTGLEVYGFTHDDMTTEDGRGPDQRYQTGSDYGQGLKQVLFMDIGGPNTNHNKVVVRGVRAKSVSYAGVLFEGDANPLENLVLSDWDLTITDEGAGTNSFEFLRGAGNWRLGKGCSFKALEATDGAGNALSYWDLVAVPVTNSIADDSFIKLDETFYVRVKKDSFVNLPVSASTAFVTMRNVRTGARPYCISLPIETTTAGFKTGGVASDVVVSAALQTDGAGLPSNTMSLTLDKDVGVLQVYHGLTSGTQTFAVSVI